MSNTASRFLGLLFLAACAIGCSPEQENPSAKPPVSESKILTLYDQLDLGMTREQAEVIVGKPISEDPPVEDDTQSYWYIKQRERKMDLNESPWGWGGIVLTYKAGKLIDKQYNSQWIPKKQLEEYERKKYFEQFGKYPPETDGTPHEIPLSEGELPNPAPPLQQ